MKDWKKAVGLFIIAVVSIVAGVFCLTVGAVPDWLSLLCGVLGGVLTTLGIWWVNPLEKDGEAKKELKRAPRDLTSGTVSSVIFTPMWWNNHKCY